MEGILGLVIHSLSVSSVYEDGSCVDPHVPAVTPTSLLLKMWGTQFVRKRLSNCDGVISTLQQDAQRKSAPEGFFDPGRCSAYFLTCLT